MLSQTVWSIKSNNTCSIKYLWNLGIFSQTLLNRPSQLADRDWQWSDIDEKSCTVLFFQKDYLCLKKLLLYPHKQSWRGALKSPCQSLCRHSFVPNTNFLTAAWNSVLHTCMLYIIWRCAPAIFNKWGTLHHTPWFDISMWN